MFSFIKEKLTKIYTTVTAATHALFARNTVDAQTLEELRTLLLQADTGVQTTNRLIDELQQRVHGGSVKTGQELHAALAQQLRDLLAQHAPPAERPIYLLVGINGSGKTTFAGKLAHQFVQRGERVLLAAADTFRAAAPEQLEVWAQRSGATLVQGAREQDPASVVFQACAQFKTAQFDRLIIDTAGRLQTKINLMRELEKIRRIIGKQLPTVPVCTLLTVDAMLGQNSFDQARLFNDATQLNGIVLTKMDGTGKGGIVFAITQELHIPVAFMCHGEQIADLKAFDAHEYVDQLLASN